MAKVDPAQQEQINKITSLKKAFLSTFNSESGKVVLEHLEKTCYVNRTTYSPEPNKLALNEGMRYVIVTIKNMMRFDVKKLYRLIEESEE